MFEDIDITQPPRVFPPVHEDDGPDNAAIRSATMVTMSCSDSATASSLCSTASSANTTNFTDADLWAENEYYARQLIPAMVYIALLMFPGIIGNLLVLYVYGYRFKSATQHFLIVCLACFDLLMSSIAMPTEIADMRFHHTFSSLFACKLLRFITYFSSIASIFTLVTITIDRHTRVTKPLARQMTVRRARLWEVLNVLIALVFSWPSLVMTGIRSSDTRIPGLKGKDCSFSDEFRNTKYPMIHNLALGAAFILLTIIIFVLYFRIWKTVKGHRLHHASERSGGSISVTSLCDVRNPGGSNGQASDGSADACACETMVADDTNSRKRLTVKKKVSLSESLPEVFGSKCSVICDCPHVSVKTKVQRDCPNLNLLPSTETGTSTLGIQPDCCTEMSLGSAQNCNHIDCGLPAIEKRPTKVRTRIISMEEFTAMKIDSSIAQPSELFFSLSDINDPKLARFPHCLTLNPAFRPKSRHSCDSSFVRSLSWCIGSDSTSLPQDVFMDLLGSGPFALNKKGLTARSISWEGNYGHKLGSSKDPTAAENADIYNSHCLDQQRVCSLEDVNRKGEASSTGNKATADTGGHHDSISTGKFCYSNAAYEEERRKDVDSGCGMSTQSAAGQQTECCDGVRSMGHLSYSNAAFEAECCGVAGQLSHCNLPTTAEAKEERDANLTYQLDPDLHCTEMKADASENGWPSLEHQTSCALANAHTTTPLSRIIKDNVYRPITETEEAKLNHSLQGNGRDNGGDDSSTSGKENQSTILLQQNSERAVAPTTAEMLANSVHQESDGLTTSTCLEHSPTDLPHQSLNGSLPQCDFAHLMGHRCRPIPIPDDAEEDDDFCNGDYTTESNFPGVTTSGKNNIDGRLVGGSVKGSQTFYRPSDRSISRFETNSRMNRRRSTDVSIVGRYRSRSRSTISTTSGRLPSRYLDKTTLVAFAISSLFVLSFLPYLLLMFIRSVVKDFDYKLEGASLCVYNIFVRFYLLNSALNPLLYGLLNERFRYECRRVLSCKFGRRS